MKLIKINILLVILVLLFSGCDKNFLEVKSDPNKISTDTFWQNETDAVQTITAAYASLQMQSDRWISFEAPFPIDNFRADECAVKLDVPQWTAFETFTNTAATYYPDEIWYAYYHGIFVANQILTYLPKSSVPENVKTQIMGEAKFLRAFFHFRLLTIFKSVPLITSVPTNKDDYYPSQAPADKIYEQIIKDLKEAKAVLPLKWADNYSGRATKGAATGLLGKVYLYQKNWSAAIAEFNEVENMGVYKLMPKYEDNFDYLNENNEESLFEIQYSEDQTDGGSESWPITAEVYSYEETWPTEWLVGLYKSDKTANGEYTSRVYGSIVFNDPKSSIWYFKGKTFEDFYGKDETRAFWKKYTVERKKSTSNSRLGVNYILLRYADILLMHAEAANETGNTSQAIELINRVRARAGAVLLQNNLSKDQITEHIRNVERPLEFAFEGLRWYDLVRWGAVQPILKAHKKNGIENFRPGISEYLPIPSKELILNPKLIQNQGF